MSATAQHYIGLMSGTSMDAIDAVLADFSGGTPKVIGFHRVLLEQGLREAMLRLIDNSTPHPLQCLGELDHLLGDAFATAALELLRQTGCAPDAVAAIGSHGQTIYHQPLGDLPFTLQVGDPNRIAAATGITTVADFRRRDMALGGQGAPLVPAFHAALFRRPDRERVVLNLGGIANITLLPADADRPVSGFDTGPANVLLDIWSRRHLDQPFDRNGAWAASGTIVPTLLEAMLRAPYFALEPPKSTGRELFNESWLDQQLGGSPASPTDVQATLLELTAVTVAQAVRRFAADTGELIACGGGAFNGQLLARIRHHLPAWQITTSGDYGLDPQWIEATAFAWLAQQTLAGLPGNVPTVTGAREAAVLGGIYPGN